MIGFGMGASFVSAVGVDRTMSDALDGTLHDFSHGGDPEEKCATGTMLTDPVRQSR